MRGFQSSMPPHLFPSISVLSQSGWPYHLHSLNTTPYDRHAGVLHDDRYLYRLTSRPLVHNSVLLYHASISSICQTSWLCIISLNGPIKSRLHHDASLAAYAALLTSSANCYAYTASQMLIGLGEAASSLNIAAPRRSDAIRETSYE
jgi:hypothetical protein